MRSQNGLRPFNPLQSHTYKGSNSDIEVDQVGEGCATGCHFFLGGGGVWGWGGSKIGISPKIFAKNLLKSPKFS